MEKIERQVAREVKAMGRREVTTNAIDGSLQRPLPLLPAMRSLKEGTTNLAGPFLSLSLLGNARGPTVFSPALLTNRSGEN